MVNEILERIEQFNSYDDIIKELLRLKKELKNNNIKYESVIDEIIGNEKVSKMLEILINKYHDKVIKNNFILELTIVYREKNRETDLEIIELMTNKTKENQAKILVMYNNLVYKYANQYLGKGVELDDLVQEGRLGLLKAYEVYDINRCTKFMTIAAWYVKWSISKEIIRNGKPIRLSYYAREKLRRILKFKNEFYNKEGRDPYIYEISKYLNIKEDKVRELLSIDAPFDSLDRNINEDDNTSTLMNFIADDSLDVDEIVEKKLLKNDMDMLFREVKLMPRDIYVLKKRFGAEDGKKYTLDDIGTELGLTREGVRQIERKALLKIKKSKYNYLLEPYINDSVAYVIEEKTVFDFNQNNQDIKERKGELMDKQSKGLKYYFKKYDLSNIEKIISSLPIEYQEILVKRFGKDLSQNNEIWTGQEENIYYKKIRPMIVEKLGEPIVKKIKRTSKDLISKLKLDEKSKLEQVLDGMYPEYIELIQKKYGINYDENNKLSSEEEELMNGKIMQALVRRAELLIMGKKLRPMQRRYYDSNESDKKMKKEDIKLKKITPPPLKCYENGYPKDGTVNNDKIEKKVEPTIVENSVIEKKEPIKVEKLVVEKEGCSHLSNIVNTSMFKEFLKTQEITDIAVCSILFGYFNKQYTLDQLVEFLPLSKEDIIKGIKSVLIEYKKYINNIIESTKDSIDNSVNSILLDDYTKYINSSIEQAIIKPTQKILH